MSAASVRWTSLWNAAKCLFLILKNIFNKFRNNTLCSQRSEFGQFATEPTLIRVFLCGLVFFLCLCAFYPSLSLSLCRPREWTCHVPGRLQWESQGECLSVFLPLICPSVCWEGWRELSPHSPSLRTHLRKSTHTPPGSCVTHRDMQTTRGRGRDIHTRCNARRRGDIRAHTVPTSGMTPGTIYNISGPHTKTCCDCWYGVFGRFSHPGYECVRGNRVTPSFSVATQYQQLVSVAAWTEGVNKYSAVCGNGGSSEKIEKQSQVVWPLLSILKDRMCHSPPVGREQCGLKLRLHLMFYVDSKLWAAKALELLALLTLGLMRLAAFWGRAPRPVVQDRHTLLWYDIKVSCSSAPVAPDKGATRAANRERVERVIRVSYTYREHGGKLSWSRSRTLCCICH